jgi:hypothetical protein
MMAERAPAFGDLGDFETRKPSQRADPRILDEIAEANGFPSRSARITDTESNPDSLTSRKPRRYTTGRNRQINVKASDATVALFYRIADELEQPLGAVLELALKALEAERGDKTDNT